MKTSYRQQFAERAKVGQYEALYTETSYSEALWQIEKARLAAFIEEFRQSHPRIDYMDFAAGTGRVISMLEDKVDSATGIEISEAMIDVAKKKLAKARMICTDITASDAEIEGRYDFITAFRFVLNAEPSLRLAALRALAARLKDKTSCIVFNNHGNLWSHKLVLWPFHKLRRLDRRYRTEGNYMTNGQAKRLAKQAGLQIDRVVGCGLLGAKAMRLMSFRNAVRLETTLANWPLLPRLGVNQMYVARLRQ